MNNITRRGFLRILGLSAIMTVIKVDGEPTGYGLIEAETYDFSKNAHVFLNGTEVSNYCTAANDIEGWADLLSHDADGHIVSPNTHRKRGKVLIVIDDEVAR